MGSFEEPCCYCNVKLKRKDDENLATVHDTEYICSTCVYLMNACGTFKFKYEEALSLIGARIRST